MHLIVFHFFLNSFNCYIYFQKLKYKLGKDTEQDLYLHFNEQIENKK